MFVLASALLKPSLPMGVVLALAAFFGVVALLKGGAGSNRRRQALRLFNKVRSLSGAALEPLLAAVAVGEEGSLLKNLHELLDGVDDEEAFDARLAELARTPEGQARLSQLTSTPGGPTNAPTTQ
jgi:hypothetical protein